MTKRSTPAKEEETVGVHLLIRQAYVDGYGPSPQLLAKRVLDQIVDDDLREALTQCLPRVCSDVVRAFRIKTRSRMSTSEGGDQDDGLSYKERLLIPLINQGAPFFPDITHGETDRQHRRAIITEYKHEARENTRQANIWMAIDKRCGTKRTGEVFDETQLLAMFNREDKK